MQQDELRNAFAKVYVRNKKDLIAIIKKYNQNISENTNPNEILRIVFELIESNPQFNNDLRSYFVTKHYIINSGDSYRNWIELLAPVVESLSEMVGSFAERPSKKDRLLEFQQAQMELIKAEQDKKAKENRNKIILASTIGLGLIGLTIFIVIQNNKK